MVVLVLTLENTHTLTLIDGSRRKGPEYEVLQ